MTPLSPQKCVEEAELRGFLKSIPAADNIAEWILGWKDQAIESALAEEREALRKYGEHHTNCFPGGTKGNPCTCGFSAALAEEGKA